MNTQPYGLHWFRRDLRCDGNGALIKNIDMHKGRVLGIFCFDQSFLARPDFSHKRFAFFLETLHSLREDLRGLGGDLLVLDGGPDKAFDALFEFLKEQKCELPSVVSWSRDYEPFARERDARMSSHFVKQWGLSIHSERDHLLIEPHELLKEDGSPYKVFTPFARRWRELFFTPEIQERIVLSHRPCPRMTLQWRELLKDAPSSLHDAFEQIRKSNGTHVRVPIPQAGAAKAQSTLQHFLNRSLDGYKEKRDVPSLAGTSQLSIYFKNGSLTGAQVLGALELTPQNLSRKLSLSSYVNELIWREFYYHILHHFPRVEHEAFIEKFQHIAWPNPKGHFVAWCEGRTGFPIVDAGMRQLASTGWMHNRVRMIVASFLVKDLLVDWRFGERFFMEHLLDGDLAPNNGGWQWAASTGCDPQPYFRIFNPWLQAAKFDPEAVYIKRHCPEYKALSAKELCDPKHLSGKGFARPLVDHSAQRAKALAIFAEVKG